MHEELLPEQASETASLDPTSPSLTDLPQELFGLIYSHLRKGEDRKHFFQSCRAVHEADAILCQISRLELRDQDLTQLSRFPKHAVLRQLKINRRTNMPIIPWTREVQPCGDLQGPPLQVLWSYVAAEQRAAELMSSVQELHLHGYNLQTSAECAPLAAHCPNLTTLALSNIRVKDAQLFEEMIAGCAQLREVDAIVSDRTSLDAICRGLAAMQDQLKVLRIAATNNPLRLHTLTFLVGLQELDLSNQENEPCLGLNNLLASCHSLKVLKLGVYTPRIHIATSPSLQHVAFRRVHLTPSLFPRLDLETCPCLRSVAIHSLEHCTPEAMDEAAEHASLQNQLACLSLWPLSRWGGPHGTHLTLIDSTPQMPGRGGAAHFIPALCHAFAGTPAAALVRDLSLHRSKIQEHLLRMLASAFPETTLLDLEHVPSSSKLLVQAARCFPWITRLRMCLPGAPHVQAYKHNWACSEGSVDFAGLARVAVAPVKGPDDLSRSGRLFVDLVQAGSLTWNEARWQRAWHEAIQRQQSQGAVCPQHVCVAQPAVVVRFVPVQDQ